jgi:phosphate transport system substrate-binding protein
MATRSKQCIIVIHSILFLFITAGCSKNESMTVAGSTTVLPVIAKAAELYKTLHGINIIVNAGGSGVGINQLGANKISIGMISRDLTEAEIMQYPDVDFITYSIGTDAVVPVVSSEIYDAGIQALTLEQITKIYLGEISNWKQLGGPDRNILVVDKEKSRGTRHVFMQAILGDKQASTPGTDLVLGSNNEEQTIIVQSEAAIGMLSFAWLNDAVKGLSIINTDNTVVEPTLPNISNGSFPITRSLLLITNGEPDTKIKAFIDFILSDTGQKIVRDSGYVSLHP